MEILETWVVCKICKKKYLHGKLGGTGTVTRHMQNVHTAIWGENSEGGEPIGAKQSQLSQSASGGLGNFVYSQKKMRDGLARYIAAAKQPFTFVEDTRFEHFIKEFVNPSYQSVSRNTARNDIQNIFQDTKKALISDFASFNCTIACTSNIWTGINNLG